MSRDRKKSCAPFAVLSTVVLAATAAFAGLGYRGAISSGTKASLYSGVYTVEGDVSIVNSTAGQTETRWSSS